jgi:DNA-binding transcriptional LysR family regulator
MQFMSKLDLTDLRLLDAIHATFSVSQAAEIIGLSQPSASVRLQRLRNHFGDPLFVRGAGRMQPTVRATALLQPTRQALGLFDGSVGALPSFEPATSRQVFDIAATSIAQISLLPALMGRVATRAPGVVVRMSELDKESSARLAAGEMHLAIGVSFGSGADFHERRLFLEHYVCIANCNHPRIGRRLTVRQLGAEGHVVVDAAGTSRTLLDRGLKRHGIERRLQLLVPSFLGLAQLVANNEFIALVPAHLARILARRHAIKVLQLPVPIASYPVKLQWHARHHRDPAGQWLRGQLVELFSDKEPAAK